MPYEGKGQPVAARNVTEDAGGNIPGRAMHAGTRGGAGWEMLDVKNDVGRVQELFGRPKKLVIYGAGASTRLLLQCFYGKGLEGSLAFIVDKNEGLDNTWCEAGGGIRARVISLGHFLSQYGAGAGERFMLLVTPFAALGIVAELDSIGQLDGMEAYLYALITDREPPVPFPLKSLGRPAIPKRIHYIWIGGAPMPQGDRENIEGWKRLCPDYEIIRWDEKSYDFHKDRYTREAYAAGQYMYATDYARKDILYRHGGIYLDTDVELVRPLDSLLYNEAFIGIEDGGQVNSGSGIGAVAGHRMLLDMMGMYGGERFTYADGSRNLKYNTYYETSCLVSRGYVLENRYQVVGGMACLPREVLMPESNVGLYDTYTENTVSNHKINPYDKSGVRKVLERIYGQPGKGGDRKGWNSSFTARNQSPSG